MSESRATAPGAAPRDRALVWGVALAVFAALWASEGSVGFTRDEGYYFTAARSYEQWLVLFGRAPFEAMRAAATERYWGYNAEHPGLAKLLFAASHLLFTRTLGWLPDHVAWRLPAWIFSALLAAWLAELGLRRSRAAGVLAPLLFFCAERPFFNAHLACFDVPICALNVWVALRWLRALDAPTLQKRLLFALAYGCALATKHNAWIWPPVLLVHALLLERELRLRALKTLPYLLLSPIVLFLAWPLLWHDAGGHLLFWYRFHTTHVHYAWWYLDHLLRRPPFPVEYPLALLALTLPATTVALLGGALARLLVDFFRRRLDPQRLLELGFAAAAIAPFMLTTTPIFGGIKHWLAGVAFLAPEAAALIAAMAALAAQGLQKPWLSESRAAALGAAAALLPGAWQIAHVHPYGTSAYGELAGDLPGAASLGMQRQFWSNNVTGVLDFLNRHARPNARVYFHEVNFESYAAYVQAGWLRRDIAYAGDQKDADFAAIQWHREFRHREPDTWTDYQTQRPVAGLYVDETPQVVVYARPGAVQ